MKLPFVCPKACLPFDTNQYILSDDYQIKLDEEGNKSIQGKVILTTPCPHCSGYHQYNPKELSCPLSVENQTP